MRPDIGTKQLAAVDYSIVMPVFHNEGCLRDTMDALRKNVIDKNPSLSCEVIFVDDGSGDNSLTELLDIQTENPKIVTVIRLTRNFGQPSARLAGLRHARGRCVVSMSADGQDPVELINGMLNFHFDEGVQVVVCRRKGRDESLFRVATSKIFYSAMRRLSFPNMPTGGFDYVLLGRQALNVILQNREAHPFFQGQVLWTGFTPKFIDYRRQKRKVGRSRWTFAKKLTLLIDGVLSYSFAPIRFMSFLGILVAILGFGFAGVVALKRVFFGSAVEGWAALMVALLLVGGVQMLMLGILGEYMWRSLAQARDRAPYVVESVYDVSESGPTTVNEEMIGATTVDVTLVRDHSDHSL